MHLNHQDLLINLFTLFSGVQLMLCLGLCVKDCRASRKRRMQAIARDEFLDPFATWVKMLERQRDRRDIARYGGVERRSKMTFSSLAKRCPARSSNA